MHNTRAECSWWRGQTVNNLNLSETFNGDFFGGPRCPLAPIKNTKRTYNSREKLTNNAIYSAKLYMSDVLHADQSLSCEKERMILIYARKTEKDHQGNWCRGLFYLWWPCCEPGRRFRPGSLHAPSMSVMTGWHCDTNYSILKTVACWFSFSERCWINGVCTAG